MSNILNNVLSSPVVQEVKYQQEPTKTSSSNLSFAKDSVTLNSLEMTENLQIVKNSMYGCNVLQGDVNGKNSYFKIAFRADGSDCEGNIGGKEIKFSSSNGHINGNYGDKEIDLQYEDIKYHNIIGKRGAGVAPKSMTIKGTIGGETIELNMPGCKVPKDADTRDVIVSLLASDYLTPFTIDGKVAKVIPSDVGSQCAEKRHEYDKNSFNENIKPLLMTVPSIIISVLTTALMTQLGSKFGAKAPK